MSKDLISKLRAKSSILAFDVVSIPFAWYLAYWFRQNMEQLPSSLLHPHALGTLLVLMVLQVVTYYHFRVYRGLWRYASIDDVWRIIHSVSSASVLMIPLFYFSLLPRIPRSILPLYGIILVTLLCGGRLVYRYIVEKAYKSAKGEDVKKVLVLGAGQAGEGLLRDLNRSSTYVPVGLLDDNIGKLGLDIHGVRVLGSIADLPRLALKHDIDLIFIAIPSAGSGVMRRIVGYCEKTGIPFRTLPCLEDLVSGKVEVNALRKVNIEDLLGRDQVDIQSDKIAQDIGGKRVLVTGAGGSIGSELCRQIALFEPMVLIMVDNNEYNLYSVERELSQKHINLKIKMSLLSITDEVGLEALFEQSKPQLVFHAAAYKHVPMLESQIRMAVLNNVIGTHLVAKASVNAQVEKFILISSDKAVNPTNVMGATKRAAEIYCQNLNSRSSTCFITVRFGNVLGSTGSVVPLFQQQLEQGGPLTVTHPDMQRYFMTIPEATQLILQAMVNGEGGEIFVLNMGEPIKISYLAEQIIRLSGKVPGKDIHIEYIGLRPGEKLFEELFHDSENLLQTSHEKLLQARFRPIHWEQLTETLHLMHFSCNNHQNDELLILLKNLVPEFSSSVPSSLSTL